MKTNFSLAQGIFMQVHRTCRTYTAGIRLHRARLCRFGYATCARKSSKRYIDFCSRARSRWRRSSLRRGNAPHVLCQDFQTLWRRRRRLCYTSLSVTVALNVQIIINVLSAYPTFLIKNVALVSRFFVCIKRTERNVAFFGLTVYLFACLARNEIRHSATSSSLSSMRTSSYSFFSVVPFSSSSFFRSLAKSLFLLIK